MEVGIPTSVLTERRDLIWFSGNFTGGVTPVPIPNTEVKSTEVDGTMVSRPWESRTLPVSFKPLIEFQLRAFFVPQVVPQVVGVLYRHYDEIMLQLEKRLETSEFDNDIELKNRLINAIALRRSRSDRLRSARQAGTDSAMKTPGGIDLSHSQINPRRDRDQIQMRFDPAMIERIRQEGFDGLEFNIESIVSVTNLHQLLGV